MGSWLSCMTVSHYSHLMPTLTDCLVSVRTELKQHPVFIVLLASDVSQMYVLGMTLEHTSALHLQEELQRALYYLPLDISCPVASKPSPEPVWEPAHTLREMR